jgi:alpha-L-fucosidase 2
MLNLKAAGKWDEAYPSGNGTQGVLVMGEPLDETIIFNHEGLFLPLPENAFSVLPDMSDDLPAVRKLIREGRYREATRYFLDRISEKGFPKEMIWTDPFHPAFDLRIRTNDSGEAADYVRWLDFETGEAGVRWRGEKGTYERRVFVSRACDAVVIKLDAPSGGRLDCDIYLAERPGRQFTKTVSIRAGTFAELVQHIQGPCSAGVQQIQGRSGCAGAKHIQGQPCSAEIRQAHGLTHPNDDIWLIFDSSYEVGNGGYCGIARVHMSGGRVELSGCTARLRNADGVVIIARTFPCEDHASFSPVSAMEELAALPPDYDRLLKEHAVIHGELFNRLRLELDGDEGAAEGCRQEKDCRQEKECRQDKVLCPDENAETWGTASAFEQLGICSNEEFMEQARSGNILPAFVERMHDFGRYLLISSSGELPPNLQGAWNGTWSPPWSSDYTLDENLQMMMWQVLPGNMPELARSYFNLIESYIDDWKTNARLFYGCCGILSSLRSTTSGLHKHFNEDFPMMFWTAGAGWLAQMFFDYWQFTGDDEFLENHTVPLLKEIALFYEDFLVEGPDGKYEFIPSYSPENKPSNTDSPVAINATMDIAVAKEVLANLVSACMYLGIENENMRKWKGMLEKLPDYMVNSDGALKEWSHPAFEDDYHHRHSSHLYPIFPGFEVTYEGDPGLYKACLRAAELRLTDGIEAITGWGLAHLANISARLKNSELGFMALSRIMAKFLLPNLFTCHNEGELFQMDANLGFSAAVLEMLVFSQTGYIELLPALPQKLVKGAAHGILCRGRITLTELRWDMCRKTVSVALRSEKDQQIRLKLPGFIESCKFGVISSCGRDGLLSENGSSRENGSDLKDGSLRGDRLSWEDGSDNTVVLSCDASQAELELKEGVETRLLFLLH